jgi:hypothetical protein
VSKTRRKPPPPQPPARDLWTYLDLSICLGIVLAILVVYAQVRHFDFIVLDDPVSVSKNIQVQAGLTPGSVKWALTAVISSNWIPVTVLSYILDVQLFGVNPGMLHLVNVLFHMLAAIALYLALQRATHARAACAFVAFVFALHPLHVESVAWIAERKDVLCAFFWFAALYAYVRYTEQPNLRRYLLVVDLFGVALLSKPMAVTFPFTLLLFDVWPLRRTQTPVRKLIREKIPLIVLSAALSVVTYLVQKESGAVQSSPLGLRVENSLVSYLVYIGQMFWPDRLAIIYPYPHSIPVWQTLAALAVILGVSAVAVVCWRTRPYLAVGWFWYLGTMVPVIGLLKVGVQSHADRYTYIPMVGLSILLAWGALDIIERWPRIARKAKPVVATAAVAFCAACMAVAWTQAAYWRNSETIFEHAIAVTGENWAAQGDLAAQLMEDGRHSESIAHFEEAVRIKPDWVEAQNNLGGQLTNVPGRITEAVSHLETAVRLRPDLVEAHYNLAIALSKIPGKRSEVIAQLEAMQRIHPDPGIAKLIESLRSAP